MKAVLIILDSVGIGSAPDAAAYGDQGAATLPHLAAAVGGIVRTRPGSAVPVRPSAGGATVDAAVWIAGPCRNQRRGRRPLSDSNHTAAAMATAVHPTAHASSVPSTSWPGDCPVIHSDR